MQFWEHAEISGDVWVKTDIQSEQQSGEKERMSVDEIRRLAAEVVTVLSLFAAVSSFLSSFTGTSLPGLVSVS